MNTTLRSGVHSNSTHNEQKVEVSTSTATARSHTLLYSPRCAIGRAKKERTEGVVEAASSVEIKDTVVNVGAIVGETRMTRKKIQQQF